MDRRSTYDLDRTLALSDGIIAFSMTLMAILVYMPNPNEVPDSQFLNALIAKTLPQAVIFCYTFIVVALYWAVHNKLLKQIVVCDGKVAMINIIFLLCIVLLAITSAMFGDYNQNKWALTIFALNMSAAGFILVWLWHYSISKRYHQRRMSDKERDYALIVKMVTPSIFLASVPIAFYNVELAELFWLLIPIVQLYLNRIDPSQGRQ
ncbi:MAG: TMEM175 family protein [Candidatus Micrarchaeia archaeon]